MAALGGLGCPATESRGGDLCPPGCTTGCDAHSRSEERGSVRLMWGHLPTEEPTTWLWPASPAVEIALAGLRSAAPDILAQPSRQWEPGVVFSGQWHGEDGPGIHRGSPRCHRAPDRGDRMRLMGILTPPGRLLSPTGCLVDRERLWQVGASQKVEAGMKPGRGPAGHGQGGGCPDGRS